VSGPAFLDPPTEGQRDALRETLADIAPRFPTYRALFARAGVGDALARADPVAALARLPYFDPATVNRLATEALGLRAHDLGGVELTSGTTGTGPKRRVLSEEDMRRDAALVAALMHRAGVRADDRVAAVELSVDPLTAAFAEGCERLGVCEVACIALTAHLDPRPLLRLDPTILIAPPSLLVRLVPTLTGPEGPRRLRLVIYNGDRLPGAAAAALRDRGVGLRSLYGLTETSALGVECPAEDGVHLATAHALTETRPAAGGTELVVTTLGFSMPLLRYPTGDLVRPVPGPCRCGAPWPRVHLLGRTGDRFALFDVKLDAEEIRALLRLPPDAPLRVELDRMAGGRDRLTLRLAHEPERRPAELRRRLRAHPQLDFLLHSRLVTVRLARLGAATVAGKLTAVVDRRHVGARGAGDGGPDAPPGGGP
jgi:phenylacetate-CoA ligase